MLLHGAPIVVPHVLTVVPVGATNQLPAALAESATARKPVVSATATPEAIAMRRRNRCREARRCAADMASSFGVESRIQSIVTIVRKIQRRHGSDDSNLIVTRTTTRPAHVVSVQRSNDRHRRGSQR